MKEIQNKYARYEAPWLHTVLPAAEDIIAASGTPLVRPDHESELVPAEDLIRFC